MERTTLIFTTLAVIAAGAAGQARAQDETAPGTSAVSQTEARQVEVEAEEQQALERRTEEELDQQQSQERRQAERAAELEQRQARERQAAELEHRRADLREAERQHRIELEQRERELQDIRYQAQLAGQQREYENSRREMEQAQQQARREMEQAQQQMAAASRKMAELYRVQVEDLGRGYRDLVQRRGFIGATIDDRDGGARVIAVTPGGPADEAGIETGDVITAVNGTVVAGEHPSQGVIELLGEVEPGATAILTVRRGDEEKTFNVETSENSPFWIFSGRGSPAPFAAPGSQRALRVFGTPGFFSTRWGDMELVPLSEQLGSYFGTTDGLLVVRAPSDDDIGLLDGDVILEIGGRKPTSPEHAMRILASFAPGETLELTIMREQRRRTLEYEIPDAGD